MINKRSLSFLLLLIGFSNPSLFCFQNEIDFRDSTGSIIAHSQFNRGNEQDVFGLISGLFPGVIVSKAGSDPNRSHDMMVRGAGTILGPQNPLIVIDGIIGAPMNLIDINSIESVKLLKGFEATKYGMQGGNGVLEIITKGFTNEPLKIELNQSVYVESSIYKDKVLGRETFLSLGGEDLGSNTTWVDEITRISVSNITNLSAKGSFDEFQYLASANVRLINGIQKGSGFNRYNFLGKLKWSPNETLSVSYGGSLTDNAASLGYGEAFRYAYRTNPTQPAYFPSGRLYQDQLADYYNPVGFIDMAQRDLHQTAFSQSVTISKKFIQSTLDLNLHYLSDSTSYGEEFSPLFLYSRNGYYVYNNSVNTQFNANLKYEIASRSTGNFSMREFIDAGYLSRKSEYASMRVLSNGLARAADTDDFGLYNLAVGLEASVKEVLKSELYLRYEKSSTLGMSEQSGFFPAFSMDLQLGAVFSSLKQFELNLSRASSGLTLYDEDYNTILENPLGLTGINPQLTFEQSINTDLGLSYSSLSGSLKMKLTRYGRKVSGIMGGGVGTGFLGGEQPPIQLANTSSLKNAGWEVWAEYSKSWTKRAFHSRFTFSTLTSEWQTLPYDGINTNFIEGRNDQPMLYQVGEPYGAIVGYPTVINNGRLVYIDYNDDGTINNDDRTTVGQALPQMWLGWRNQVDFGATKISFLLEGVFGHYIVNSTNFLRGINVIEGQNINILETRPDFHDGSAFFNSQFSESANYARLRYLAIDHEIQIAGHEVELFFVANNLFTVSSFKGNDPSARLIDQLDVPSYYFNRHGIQRTKEWLPSRSLMIGVKMSL